MAQERETPKRTWKRGPGRRTLRNRLWDRTGFRNKTVWDLLQLLIVPIMLAAIGYWFTTQQDLRQQAIENRRAANERELQQQAAQEDALQAYLDQMSTLLLEKDLRTPKESSEARTLARARTLTVLDRLSPERRARVLRFLMEASLVQGETDARPVISLQGANLSSVDLVVEVSPILIDLTRADLRDAKLRFVFMRGADLTGSNLSGADMYEASLEDANLEGAIMRDSHPYSAHLSGARLKCADLTGADLTDTDLTDADLTGANLRGADIGYADLSGANLREADLTDAFLFETNLTEADLTDANVTQEQLEASGVSLKGATMPNGQKKYENWLKSKGRGEGGANGCPS
jgi:uncharacterized protein YjbI with pentapeptide repeats